MLSGKLETSSETVRRSILAGASKWTWLTRPWKKTTTSNTRTSAPTLTRRKFTSHHFASFKSLLFLAHVTLLNIPNSHFIPFPSNNAPLEDVFGSLWRKTNKQQPYGRNDPLNWKLSRVFMWFVAKECFWTNPYKKNGQRTNISLNQASASLCVMLKLEAHIVFIHWSTAVLSHTNIDQCGTQQKLVASKLQKILGWETPGVRFSSAPWAAVSWEVWKRGNSFMALLSGMK